MSKTTLSLDFVVVADKLWFDYVCKRLLRNLEDKIEEKKFPVERKFLNSYALALLTAQHSYFAYPAIFMVQ